MSSVRRRANQHMSEEEFEALILGTLPPAVQTDLEAHIVDCAECSHEYGNPQELLAALPFGTPDSGDAFRAEAIWQGIADRLDQAAPSWRPDSPLAVLPSNVPDNVVPFTRRNLRQNPRDVIRPPIGVIDHWETAPIVVT